MLRRNWGLLCQLGVLMALFLGVMTSAGVASTRATPSSVYSVVVNDGGVVFHFTWTLHGSTGTSVNAEYGFVDPLTGSLSASGGTIVRHCGPGARARFPNCGTQTYTLHAAGNGVLKGTGVGFGVVEGTTITARLVKGGTITGKVQETSCGVSACTTKGLGGVTVTASGAGGGSATTKPNGAYSIDVDEGSYTVTPSLADKKFEPPFEKVVVPPGGTTSANFKTCAVERRTQSARGGARTSKAPCELVVKIVANTTVKSGKSYDEKAAIPVGFGEPVKAKDGDFRWKCRTGCVNVRIHVTEPKTGRPPLHPTQVTVKAVTTAAQLDLLDSSNVGTLCDARPELSDGCSGGRLASQINAKTGDLDFYYWAPGVVKRVYTFLTVDVRSKGYADVTRKLRIEIEPNVAFKEHTVVFQTSARNAINNLVPVLAISSTVDLADYCGWLVTFSRWVATGVVGWPVSEGFKNIVRKAAELPKAIKGFCGLIETPLVLPKVKIFSGWMLYWIFGSKLDLPPSGLIGPPTLFSFLSQVVLEYSSFFDEFNAALKSFYFDRAGFLDADQVGVSNQDTLTLQIYEVSHRRASGNLQNAIYLSFTGKKHGAHNLMRDTTPYTAYVEDGYFPGCWLNKKLNQQQAIVDNICHTEEEEPH